MTPYNLLALNNKQWLAIMDMVASDDAYIGKEKGELIFGLCRSGALMGVEPYTPIKIDQILPVYEAYLNSIENRRVIHLPKLTSVTWIMVARMTADNSVFLSHYDERTQEYDGIAVAILLNDVFYWACADAESTQLDEIPMLYKLWCENPLNLIRFAAEKRQRTPQQPMLDWMSEQGFNVDWAISLKKVD